MQAESHAIGLMSEGATKASYGAWIFMNPSQRLLIMQPSLDAEHPPCALCIEASVHVTK